MLRISHVARLSSLQKAERVLRFVLSLRNPKISGVLVAHGFGPKDLDEVWTLLRATAPVSFAPLPPSVTGPAEAEQQVRAWQRRWTPVITASLRRHAPNTAAAWRDRPKIARSSLPVAWAMSFLLFYDALGSTPPDSIAKEVHTALHVLSSRGLTPQVVDELRTLTKTLQSLPVGNLSSEPEGTPDIEEAIGKLWAWYLEWGQVLRTQAGDGRILRQAGFLSGDRRSKPVRRKKQPQEE